MALIKDFVLPSGFTAKYHRMVGAEVDVNTMTIRLTMAVYASAEARESGGKPAWHERPVIPFSAIVDDPRCVLYCWAANYYDSYLKGAAADQEVPVVSTVDLAISPEAEVPPPPPPPPVESPAPAPAPAPAPTTASEPVNT